MTGEKKNNRKEEIFIGSLIQKKFKESGLSIAEFASQIACEVRNVQKIFKKEHLSSDLLLKISQVLNYDFFEFYSQQLHPERKEIILETETCIKVNIPEKEIEKLANIIEKRQEMKKKT
jgi:transcriptional regulator with XRE-family HTH domain